MSMLKNCSEKEKELNLTIIYQRSFWTVVIQLVKVYVIGSLLEIIGSNPIPISELRKLKELLTFKSNIVVIKLSMKVCICKQ